MQYVIVFEGRARRHRREARSPLEALLRCGGVVFGGSFRVASLLMVARTWRDGKPARQWKAVVKKIPTFDAWALGDDGSEVIATISDGEIAAADSAAEKYWQRPRFLRDKESADARMPLDICGIASDGIGRMTAEKKGSFPDIAQKKAAACGEDGGWTRHCTRMYSREKAALRCVT